MDLNKTFSAVQYASRKLLALNDEKINQILLAVADAAENRKDFILAENRKDLDRMDISNPKYDRLKLTADRLKGIADDIRKVAKLPSPVGRVQKQAVMPNGLKIKRVSVPFGVIGIIYEARPNVLKQFEVDLHVVELLPSDREATAALLHANGYVDLIIPRGSSNLINFVRQNATIPVIETGAGICHTFFDRYGDVKKGAAIVNNAKTRRVSVCNALDCLLVDGDRMKDLPALCAPLQESNVIIYADTLAYASLQGHYPAELLKEATEEDFGTEFLDYKLAVKVVEGMDSAIAHIQQYGSKHSECIVTEDKEHADWFCREVDAACVYVNAPTSFTDGAQFGLGAEIGISTQKLHARGPMALEEITTYKWIIEGEGQIRK